jgi:predicted transposase YdaD
MTTLAERLRKEGEEKGKFKGKAEGKAEQTVSSTKKLLTEGHDMVYVVRLTDLPVEEVKKLNGAAQQNHMKKVRTKPGQGAKKNLQ